MDLNKIINAIAAFLQALFGRTGGSPVVTPAPTDTGAVPVLRKVLVLVYDPPIPSAGGRKLSDVMQWHLPTELISGYTADLKSVSSDFAQFQIVQQIQVNHFPIKEDHFNYNGDDYINALRAGAGFHLPDTADYHAIIDEFDLIGKINAGMIDEVWMFGFPYSGFYESRMVGPNAFWCNAPPILDRPDCSRRFVIMGFSHERGVGEMLESFAHRCEYTLQYVFRKTQGTNNLWQQFIRYEKNNPGKAEVGSVHFAPNSEYDYDWGNRRQVLSGCKNWLQFPNLMGTPVMVDCSEWGGGDIRQHHVWWLRHFPHIAGSANGISYNWWQYVINPNKAN